MMPTVTQLEVPFLKALSALGGRVTPQDMYTELTNAYPDLTEFDLQLKLVSGHNKWRVRIRWVRQRLIDKGQVRGSERGIWEITPKGQLRLDRDPSQKQPDSTFLDIWKAQDALSRDHLIPITRRFTLEVLSQAARIYGVSDAGIEVISQTGQIQAPWGGSYRQRSYQYIEGVTPFFKQHLDNSAVFERAMLGTEPSPGNRVLASIRIDMATADDGYRISRVSVGLLQWDKVSVHNLDELIKVCEEAWSQQGIAFSELIGEDVEPRMWGASLGANDWSGTEDDLVETLGVSLAALLHSMEAWRKKYGDDYKVVLHPRFHTLGRVEDVAGKPPTAGPYQLSFSVQDSLHLPEPGSWLDCAVDGKPLQLRISKGAGSANNRSATSCRGAFGSIRELGLSLGLQHGDKFEMTRLEDGTFVIESTPERGAPSVADDSPFGGDEDDMSPVDLDQVLSAFAQSDLIYDESDLINLHLALRALDRKHFVILHGVSGTGKSQFAQAYANALYGRSLQAPGNPYYLLVPVQPTWQDRTPLLGYYNPIDESYVQPPFLKHVMKAGADSGHTYIVCLDEMNLAVVEHYLADFLSVWESDEAIPLHGLSEEALGVPGKLPIPPNLMIIGTVNMDETTHGFSPKVLDRAFTVELSRVDVEQYAERMLARHPEHAEMLRPALNLLGQLNRPLEAHGLHFAYRTMDEITRFLVANSSGAHRLPDSVALDLMIAQKILPKFRGDDRQQEMLEKVRGLLEAALGPHPTGGEYRSLQALSRMMRDVRFGTFQFWR